MTVHEIVLALQEGKKEYLEMADPGFVLKEGLGASCRGNMLFHGENLGCMAY